MVQDYTMIMNCEPMTGVIWWKPVLTYAITQCFGIDSFAEFNEWLWTALQFSYNSEISKFQQCLL